jgi:CBS domain-containing protein
MMNRDYRMLGDKDRIKNVMTANVRTCFKSDNLATAAQLMWEHDCGCVPVLNERAQVVGVVTDRDICMAAFFQGRPIAEIKVSNVMSRRLFVCSSDDDLSAAESTMSDNKVRRLPVLDEQARLVGLLSLSDIARTAHHEYVQGAVTRAVTDAQVARLTAAISRQR